MAWPLANHFESTGHSFSSHLAFTSRAFCAVFKSRQGQRVPSHVPIHLGYRYISLLLPTR
ncbi:hypothetical protein CCACVL1_05988 [Corchorus capsularis]|uniref:Uncharacterized protein n=1 Tax=Corchorus capsularis TaxID=210143 RepID=A0A1R3JI69_COCAP|nr:hypothetical protein CCACVL1_05988 [Corchorus capsularis]